MSKQEITLKDIQDAQERIKKYETLTPLLKSENISSKIHSNIYLKLENLQRCKAFKFRGALSKISTLPKGSTVVCASAGNHSQGCALASTICGLKCIVYMPKTAPKSKVDATKKYGGEVRQFGECFDEAEEKCEMDLKSEPSLTFVPPFDDNLVIAGQGTIGLEIFSQLRNVQTVVLAVGGGGLCAGVSIALKSLNPNIRIIAVNSAIYPATYIKYQKIKNRKIDDLINDEENNKRKSKPLADGIAVKIPGYLTFPYIEKYVDEFVVVSEHEIACAISVLAERVKVVAEGAGASTVAAVLFNKFKHEENENIVCILSGGNITLQRLAKCFAESNDFLESI